MNLLILGGGVFLGAATLQSALTRGHQVTVFNRGRSRTAWPEGVQVRASRKVRKVAAPRGTRVRWCVVSSPCA